MTTTTTTTTGRRLRPSRLQDGDYDHHDYRTATTTITTTGRRLRPSRLQGGDYDHHDSRVATTTITTTGWRLRPSRLQGGDYDDYRAATTTTTGRRPPRVRRHDQDVHHVMSTIMFHQIHKSYIRIYFKPEADQPHYLTDYKLKETTFSTICI